MNALRRTYRVHGYVVARNVVSTELLRDMRAQVDEVRAQVARLRSAGFDDEDRLQPLRNFAEVDASSFRRLWASPAVTSILRQVLSRRHVVGRHTGVLVEPSRGVNCVGWHRDAMNHVSSASVQTRYFRRIRNPALLSQAHVPLLEDAALWIVPGSFARGDLPEELVARQEVDGVLREQGLEMSKRCALDAAERMPGAVNVPVAPGDLLIYRAGCLHMSIRCASEPRATVIDRPQCLSDILEETRLRAALQAATGSK